MPNPDEGIPLLVPYQRPSRNARVSPDPDPQMVIPRRQTTRRKRPVRRPSQPTELYRLFDANGILLYVGITMQDAGGRLEQHSQQKPWWHLVTDIKIQRAPKTKSGGFERDEYEAILNEFPAFNIKGVPWRTRRPTSLTYQIEEMRNAAEVAGAVARLDDNGVVGRLAVFEQTEPERYAQMAKTVDREFLAGRTTLSWLREALIHRECLYFEDALQAEWNREVLVAPDDWTTE